MLPILAATQAIGAAEKLATGLSSAWKSLSANDSSKPAGPSFSDVLAGAGGDLAAPAAKGKTPHAGNALDATAHRLLNRVA